MIAKNTPAYGIEDLNAVKERLNLMLKDRYGYSDEQIKRMQESGMFSGESGFSVTGLIGLFYDIEKTFGISFYKQDLFKFQFDNYNELVEQITEKVMQAR